MVPHLSLVFLKEKSRNVALGLPFLFVDPTKLTLKVSKKGLIHLKQ